ncbi:MAG: PAS domain S-box protein [Candidatus Zixiibacteriota bacterium]
MKSKDGNSSQPLKIKARKMMLITIGLGLLLWILQPGVGAFSLHQNGFIQRMLGFDPGETHTPSLVRYVLVTFGLAALFVFPRRRSKNRTSRAEADEWSITFDSARDMIMVLDRNCKVTRANLASVRFFGKPASEIVGQPCQHLLYGTAAVPLNCPLEKTKRTNRREEAEIYLEEKNLWVLVSVDPIPDKNGHFNGAVHISRNITPRKQAEEALKESEEKYKALIEGAGRAGEGIIIIQDTKEGETVFVFVNDRFCDMSGYSREELLGRSPWDLVPHEISIRLKDWHKRRHMGESLPSNYEAAGVRKDGTIVPLDLSIVTLPWQGRTATALYMRDISEHKQAEEKLKLEQERLEIVTQNIGVGLAIISKDYRTLWANSVLKEIFGEVEGKACYSTYNQRTQVCPGCGVKQAFEDGKLQAVHEQVGKDKEGRTIWSQIIATPIKDKKGNIEAALEAVVPITERKRAEQIQTVLYRIANAANTAKDLGELFKTIREELGTVLDTTNFYIALRGKETGVISLAYHIDEKGKFDSFPPGRTLTSYILKTGEPILVTQEVRKRLIEAGEIDQTGTPSKVWLGAPLKIDEEVRGVIGVQNYTNPSAYGEGEVEILRFVSQQIATAIDRVRAQEALRESEERFRQLAENIDHVFWLTDWENSKLLYVNPSYQKLFGRSCQSAYQDRLNWYQVIHADDRDRVRESLVKNAKLGQSTEVEYRIVRDDGTIRWILDRNYPVRDRDGKVCRIASIAEDITERKRAEQALRESEERLKLVLEGAELGSWDQNMKTGKVVRNPRWAEMLGYTLEEIDSHANAWKELIHPDDLPIVNRTVEDHEAGRTPSFRCEHRMRTKSGDWKWILNCGKIIQWDSDGKPIRATGTHTDITERKLTEEALRESEERYRNLFENSPIGIYRTAPDGRILMSNPAIIRMLGYSSFEELASRNLEKEGYDASYPRSQFRQLIESKGEVKGLESVWIKNDKSVLFVRENAKVVRDDKGAVLYYEGTAEDITERKRAEELLRTSEAQLSNAMKIAKLGYWEYDVAEDLFTFNDHFYAIFRTTAEQVGGYTMSSARYAELFVHPDDMSVVGIEIRKALETTDPHFNRQLEHRIIYGDGKIGHVAVRFFIVKDSQGRTVKTYGVNQDITERKRAEEQIAYQAQLLAIVNDAVVASDAQYRLTALNAAAESMYGWKAEEVLGRLGLDITRTEFPGVDKAEMLRAIAERGSWRGEATQARKDGTRFPVEVSSVVLRDATGKVTGYVSVNRDITQRKEAENALRLEKERAQRYLDIAGAMMLVVDADGKVTLINRKGCEILEYQENEIVGKKRFDSFLPGRHRREVKQAFDKMVSREMEPVEYAEGVVLTKSGEERVMAWQNALLTDEAGSVTGAIISGVDITDRKRAEEQILRQSKVLNAINKVLKETLRCETDEDVARACLSVAEELTGSEFGFIGEVNQAGSMDIIAESDLFGDMSQMPKSDAVAMMKNREVRGIWGRVLKEERSLIVNDPASSLDRLVAPDGHPPVTSFLGVPLKHEGRTIGMITLANKESRYGLADQEDVEALSVAFVEALNRKRAEQSLKVSEAKNRAILKAIPDSMFRISKDGIFVEAMLAKDLSGYFPPNEFAGKSVYQITPEIAEQFMPGVKKALETNEIEILEYQIDLQGDIRYHEARVVASGKDEVLSIVRDITERNRAAEEVSRQKAILQTIFDNIPVMIVFFDANGQIAMVNQALEKTLGWLSEEISEINLLEKCYPDPHYREEVIKYMLKGEPGWRDFRTMTKDHRTIDTTWSNVKCLDGSSIGIGQDITGRKQAEETLRTSETLLKEAQHVAHVGHWELGDLAGTPIWSEEVFHIFGLDPLQGEPSFADHQKIIHPDDWHVLNNAVRRAITDRLDFDIEFRVIRPDKSIRWMNAKGYASQSDETNLLRIFGTAQDITERKRAEEEIRKLSQYLESVIDNANVWVDVLDEKANVVIWNKAAEEISGYSRDEVLGHGKIWDWLYPDEEYRNQIITKAAAIIEKGEEVEDFETTIRCKDGEIRTISWHSRNLVDEKGIPIGSIALGRDITERQKAMEALRESQAKLQSIFSAVPAGIGLTIDQTIKELNTRLCEISGYSKEELLGKSVSIVYPSDRDYLSARDEIYKQLGEKGYSTIETSWRRKDGKLICVLLNCALLKPGDLSHGITFTVLDITERKRLEESLAKERQDLKLIIDSSPIITFYKDKEGKFIRINKTLSEALEIPEEEFLGKTVFDLYSSKIARDMTNDDQEVFKSGHPKLNIIEQYESASGIRWVQTDKFPIVESGILVGLVGFAQDITEKKKMEDQLIQSERLAAVGTLAYGIAHEFNNILAGILGNAEYGMENDDPAEVKECLRTIMENCDRAKSITYSLLALSRQREVKRQRTSIVDSMESVLGLTERELEKQGIKVLRKFNPVPEIVCDLGQFSEVFLNMITNARDAMRPKGGTLTIEIRQKGDNLEISFTDTGCGIPESIMGRIFEPFVTTKGALGQSEIPGTGLGLFVSYGIVSRYHGKIEVKSKVGAGSTFTVKIPILENQVAPVPTEMDEERVTKVPQGLAVLVVDDEMAISTVIKKFLEAKGHSVVTSPSGKNGLKIFRKRSFDLVLSDITMPDMDGLELISKVKSLDQDVKLIVLTGHLAEEKLNLARKAGADHILTKPFRNEELYKAIGWVLGG